MPPSDHLEARKLTPPSSQDCLTGEIEPVGEFLPEFLVLGMGKRSQAYFMCALLSESSPTRKLTLNISDSRCVDCIEAFVAEPELAVRWEQEKAETSAKLKEMGIEI